MVEFYKRVGTLIFVLCILGIFAAAQIGEHIKSDIALFTVASTRLDMDMVVVDTRLLRPYYLLRDLPNRAEVGDIFLAYAHDGRHIAFYSDSERGLYVAETSGRYRRRVSTPCDGAVTWSPDDKYLLCDASTSFHDDPEAYVQDARVIAVTKHAEFALTPDPEQGSMWAVWSPDGTRIAYVETSQSSPFTHMLMIANADGSGAREIGAIESQNSPLNWLADGTQVIYAGTCGISRALVLWNVDTLKSTCLPVEYNSPIFQGVLSPDTTRLAYAGMCGLTVLTLADGSTNCMPLHTNTLSAAWTSDSARLVYADNHLIHGGYETTLNLYNVANETSQVIYALHDNSVLTFEKLAWSPDDGLLAFTPHRFNGDGMQTQVLEMATGQSHALGEQIAYQWGGFSAWQP